MICTIVPPFVEDEIEKNGTDLQKAAARRSRAVMAQVRARREMAPLPQPSAGSDRAVYTANNKTKLPGTKVRSELDPLSDDQEVNEAFDGAGNTYRLFLAEYGRNSLDGKGLPIISSVHFDKGWDNAAWDGEQMLYGDGFLFQAFTRDLTVVGHELAHGITQHTANLVYQGQSGALNEHISDVFGALTEQYAYVQNVTKATWLIGQLLVEGKLEGRALRDMLHPGTAYDDPVIGKDPQPAHMDQFYKGSDDNGGVHINSGIPNRAFALACIELGGYAWERIGKVWYTVLTEKCGPKTQFQAFANMTVITAGELYGKQSKERLVIWNGWNQVGIVAKDDLEEPPPPPDTEQSPCTPELMAILSDPITMKRLVALGKNPRVRKFVAAIHSQMRALKEDE